MAIAENALFGFGYLDDVRKQEILEGEGEMFLRFNDLALKRPILRQCTKVGSWHPR